MSRWFPKTLKQKKRVRAKAREWYRKNREKCLARARAYQARTAKHRRAYAKKYYREHKAEIMQKVTKWKDAKRREFHKQGLNYAGQPKETGWELRRRRLKHVRKYFNVIPGERKSKWVKKYLKTRTPEQIAQRMAAAHATLKRNREIRRRAAELLGSNFREILS